MNNYDFGALLSPLRFEQLTRDLLTSRNGYFENFAEGNDGGIDFRYSHSNGRVLIVQCKRYKNVASLLSSLTIESKKAAKLAFTDYLLVVSVDLTPLQKDKILEIYGGKIKNPNQIITSGDLNARLAANPGVEFSYPELWMKSVNIHQKIFQLGFLKHSEFIRDRILDSLKTFVPYSEYYKASTHLENENVVILSGVPGIGKTTLAYAVISSLMCRNGYQLIDLTSRHIQEAESFIHTEAPIVFFLDDVFGQINLEKDNSFSNLLLSMVLKVMRVKNKKIVITSRENILRSAGKSLYPVGELNRLVTKFTIELPTYTRLIRTEILLNHLVNSRLEPVYIESFKSNDFKKVIDHPNYSPRIIDHLTNPKFLKNITPGEYFSFFIENLNRPKQLWEQIYDCLPNDLYKLTLFVKFLLKSQIPVKKLEKAIHKIVEESPKFQQYSFDEFDYVIREMEGTFIRLDKEHDEFFDETHMVVEFQNPSVKDFLNSILWEKTSWLKLIINHSVYFEQLFNDELHVLLEKDEALFKVFLDKVLKDFSHLTNASFGYFEYEVEEQTFNCMKNQRRLTFLSMLLDLIVAQENYILDKITIERLNSFLEQELYQYPLDGIDDISEKTSYLIIAEHLIKVGVISSEKAINGFLACSCNSIKELVQFEYMTRACSAESIIEIKKNREFAKEADDLFLAEIPYLYERDFLDIFDFLDDLEQLSFLFSLPRTRRKLKRIGIDSLITNAIEKRNESLIELVNLNSKDQVTEYKDVDDTEIDKMFNL